MEAFLQNDYICFVFQSGAYSGAAFCGPVVAARAIRPSGERNAMPPFVLILP